MRVLFVSCDPLEGAVTRYRCTHLAEALRAAGHTADVATIYDPAIRLEHDIVVLHRICANAEGQALADAVRKSGATLIYGADDLVWEAPSGHLPRMLVPRSVPSSPVAPSSREEGLAESHLAMLRQADGVLVSTNALAEFAGEANVQSVHVLRNVARHRIRSFHGIDMKLYHQRRSEGVVLMYPSGTPTHSADFAEITPVLKKIFFQFSSVTLLLIGHIEMPDSLNDFKDRVHFLPSMKWEDFRSMSFYADIILAPLEETRFNQGKSEIKWQESAAWSRATIATRWGGFAEAIRDGEDGFLASSPKEWEEKLSLLIRDTETREKLGCAAATRMEQVRVEESELVTAVFAEWEAKGNIQSTLFANPKGFVKGYVKAVLRRLKA